MSPKSKPKLFDKFDIKPNISLGLDVGTASCGWCWVENLDTVPNIVKAGVWMFKEPVDGKESNRVIKNQVRRSARLARRTLYRRVERRQDMRLLLTNAGFLEDSQLNSNSLEDALARYCCDPWNLRIKGLNEKLELYEIAAVVAHINKRRGFKSNAKNQKISNEETSEMLKKMHAFQKEMLGKTYAQTVTTKAHKIAIEKNEPERYRNREKEYDFTPSRDDVWNELKKILLKQKEFYPDKITLFFQEKVKEIFYRLAPMKDFAHLVGKCTFSQKPRCSQYAPSFELFRFLCKLLNLKLSDNVLWTEELIAKCENIFWKQEKVTYVDLEKELGHYFINLEKKERKQDITSSQKNCGTGTHTLKNLLPYLFNFDSPHQDKLSEVRDDIAWIMTFYKNPESIKRELDKEKLELTSEDKEILLTDMQSEDNSFVNFTQSGHLASEVVRKIIPYLRQGFKYDKACEMAGYPFRERKWDIDDITNPSANKSIRETLKQVTALIERQWEENKKNNNLSDEEKLKCIPEKIFIEMTRELANSKKQKKKIFEQQKAREAFNTEKYNHFQEICKDNSDIRSKKFLRFKLWEKQQHICPYSFKKIPAEDILSSRVEIDHILPKSRFFDNSGRNQVLVWTSENRKKKNDTPYEWMTSRGEDWDIFSAKIKALNLPKGTEKHILLHGEEAKRIENDQMRAALHATGYATRFLKSYLAQEFYGSAGHEEGGVQRVLARSGQMTSLLRKSWGIEALKYIKSSDTKKKPERTDQRHHAVDALVVALSDGKLLHKVVEAERKRELQGGEDKNAPDIPPPFPHFYAYVKEFYDNEIQVSRSEDRRVRGELHDQTIHAVKMVMNAKGEEEKRVVKRIPIKDLKSEHVVTKKGVNNLVGNPERNEVFKNILLEWLAGGKKQPLKINNIPIKKVSCYINSKDYKDESIFEVRGGTAKCAMHRVDIFTKANAKGVKQYFMIPIYNYQVLDNKKTYPTAPNQAIDGNIIDDTYDFQFSLYPWSYVKIIKKLNEQPLEGFYRGCDSANNAINLSKRSNKKDEIRGIGIKTLFNIQKFTMNRLGDLFEIKKEKRLW